MSVISINTANTSGSSNVVTVYGIKVSQKFNFLITQYLIRELDQKWRNWNMNRHSALEAEA